MQDNSNNNSEQNKPQARPWFSPKPDVPQGRNLIGDNPFYNYLAKPNPNVAMRQPTQPNIPAPVPPIQPNTLPFYGGSRQHYKDTADILWNEPDFNFKSFDPTNLEHTKAAQTSLSDWIDEHTANIMANPNPSYQEKQFVKENLDNLLQDSRFYPYYNLIKLQKKKVQQDEEEFNKLKAEEEELRKNFIDYGTFKPAIHDDITNLIKKGGDINLLLEPIPENFPKSIEFLRDSGLTSAEYDKILNTRREGYWDRFFGSGDLEPDDIEKIYKGLRLYSKKPQAFGKFLKEIDPLYADWAKKHYTKGVEEGGEPFDSNIKHALNQLHIKLLEEGRQKETNNEEENQKKIEQWKDENIKEIFRSKAYKQPAKNLANALTELVKVQGKFPKSLSEQPKEIDLDNFILGSRDLNDYLIQFFKTNPYGDWKKELRNDLKKTFIPYYNQHLSYGNTIDKLINHIDDKVKTAGGVEKFLVENIKQETEKKIVHKPTPKTIIDNLKERNAYLKKKGKQRVENDLTKKIVTELEPELESELINQATKKINKDVDNLKYDSQTSDKNLPEVESTLEETIDDIVTYYKNNPFGPGGKFIEEFEKKGAPYILESYDKLKTYIDEQYKKFPNIYEAIKDTIEKQYQIIANEFVKKKDEGKTAFLEKQKEVLQDAINTLTQLKNYTSEQYKKSQEELTNAYSKLRDYLKDTWQDISQGLEEVFNPQIEEEVLKKFGNQNPYIKESLVWDIDTMVETISDILSEELIQQDIEFDEEDLKEQVGESIKPIVIDNIITKNEKIVEEAKTEIAKKQSEIKEILKEQKVREPLNIRVFSDDEGEEFTTIGTPGFEPIITNITLPSGEIRTKIHDIEEVETPPEIIAERKQKQKEKYEKTVNALETISSILGEIRSISKKMMEYEANKKNTTVEEVEREIQETINNKVEEVKKQKVREPLNIRVFSDDDEEEFTTIGTPGFEPIVTNVTLADGSIRTKIQEIEEIETPPEIKLPPKVIKKLKPIEQIYYNNTLLNEQSKKLENIFVDKNNQPIKLGGDKKADLAIDAAQEVYNKEVGDKANRYLHNPNMLKYYRDYIYDILKPFKKELDQFYKIYDQEKYLYLKDINEGKTTIASSLMPEQYLKRNLFLGHSIKKLLETAKQNQDPEEILILDYIKDYNKESLKDIENFLQQKPETFKEIKEVLNKAQSLVENKILDEEVKPGLVNYINTSPTNNNDLKNSIKELGKAIQGLSEQQLNKAIKNLSEEDRKKLVEKVTNNLNTLLDSVKEYAPEVMESFDKLVEAQNIETQVKNYHISPETLQTIENKINEILGEGKLTQQAADDKIIEITGGKGLQEIENTINSIKDSISQTHYDNENSIKSVQGFYTFARHGDKPSDVISKNTFEVFEINELLRILYPIFKNMGHHLSDYNIYDPYRIYTGQQKIQPTDKYFHSTAILDAYGLNEYKKFNNNPELIDARSLIRPSTYREGGAFRSQYEADSALAMYGLMKTYQNYIAPKFEELKNLIKNLPNFPDWLAKSTLEPNLEKAVEIAKEHGIEDPSIDEFMEKYKEYQETMKLIRQRMEELFKIHAAFVAAEDKEDDSIWGSVLGAVLGAVAAFATPWGAGILTPSILAGTAAGTATSVGLGAIGGATLGGAAQSMLGAKEYSNPEQVRGDINELDNVMKEYYQKADEAQTKIRQKIIDLGTEKE